MFKMLDQGWVLGAVDGLGLIHSLTECLKLEKGTHANHRQGFKSSRREKCCSWHLFTSTNTTERVQHKSTIIPPWASPPCLWHILPTWAALLSQQTHWQHKQDLWIRWHFIMLITGNENHHCSGKDAHKRAVFPPLYIRSCKSHYSD